MRKKDYYDSGKADKKMLKTVAKQRKPWWKKLLLAPFKLVWWTIKLVLSLVTFGYLSGAFNSKD